MSILRIGAQLAVLAALISGLPVQAAGDIAPSNEVRQNNPVFPPSELKVGHEGWVIVQYSIETDGSVSNVLVTDSSGSQAFEKAALDAVGDWQFETGDARTKKVQIQFVFERPRPQVSKTFYRKLRQVHEAIELGELDAASGAIRSLRQSDSINVFENAYLLVAEGRIAEREQDLDGQLSYFRRAALSQGRWLGSSDYLKLLHGMTILELQLGEYEAAMAHYEELIATREGRKLAGDLDGAMHSISARLLPEHRDVTEYAATDHVVSVVREYRRLGRPQGPADDGFRPQPAPAPEPSQSGGT